MTSPGAHATPLAGAAAAGPLTLGSGARRVLVIGLDCAAPELVFDRFAGELEHLPKLMNAGQWGLLESVVPAITIPAWAAAMTGCDPGQLGIYGFRIRTGHGYDDVRLVDSTDVRQPAVWDVLSRARRPVILLGVPPSYPPRRVHGCQVGCFLTPDTTRTYTFPATLADEIASVVGAYYPDVRDFRTDDRERVRRQAEQMTRRRFRLFRHLLKTRPWDFAMVVEIGLDRMHHAFWSCYDSAHPRHVPAGPERHALRDYYRLLDRELGDTLELADADTAVVVMSDHGAKRLHGGVCLNEWLRQRGYLTLKQEPREPAPLSPELVDWDRTKVWGEGGYCGRLHLNVRGRQPAGTVAPEEVGSLLDELTAGLQAIPDDRGRPLATTVFRPVEIYRECRGIPPDLLVYFGDLDWRAVGLVGSGGLHTRDNDTGPDDANHDRCGIWAARGPGITPRGAPVAGLRLVDCGPAVLRALGLSAQG